MGDPSGIGPDVVLLGWSKLRRGRNSFFVIGDADVYAKRARELSGCGDFRVKAIAGTEEANSAFAESLPVLPLGRRCAPVTPGQPDARNVPAIVESIEYAVKLVITGNASGIVTSPIAKYILMQHGFTHAGHTEYLAELAHRHGHTEAFPVMMMASETIMAVPVTVHIALKDVPTSLNRDLIVRTAEVTHRSLRQNFGIGAPRLAVCGLNPHAGENGQLGREEIDVISPAIEKLTLLGINATGPHSADTLFHGAARSGYDAVLAMYHDQALIPFKTLAFADGVNVTLGLPFIRTSPDHGTAFSLAGTGHADPTSFIEAVRLAGRMHERSIQQPALRP